MKLLIALAAAAAVFVAAPAMAARTINVGGTCNVLTVTVQDKTRVAMRENDACTHIIGEGFVGSIQHQRGASIAYTDPSLPGTQLTLLFQYPFVSGGTWVLFATSDGKTMSQIENGTYTVGGTATGMPPSGGTALGHGK